MTQLVHRTDASSVVDLARFMIEEQNSGLIGIWPRAAAILGRQALEIALDQLWSYAAPGVENAPVRAQLTCLTEYIDARLASRVRYTWHGLSAACHHHLYELPPTASELEGWLADVEALIAEVDRQTGDAARALLSLRVRQT